MNEVSESASTSAGILSYVAVESNETILPVMTNDMDHTIQKLCTAELSIGCINVAESEEYVVNIRGQKLHVKSYCPIASPRCLLLSLHGYSAHNNSPWKPVLGEEFAKQGIAYIVFDFHGHGYSDGERVLVEDKDHLTDDCMSVLAALYSSSISGSSRYFQDFKLKESGFNCPFLISGESLGGLITLTASFEVQLLSQSTGRWFNFLRDYEPIRTNIVSLFIGCISLCPAIHLDKPPSIVVQILKYCVVPCFPTSELPSCIAQPPLDLKYMFYDDYIKYAEKDNLKSDPPGLCSAPLIRFRTALSILHLTETFQQRIKDIKFPFLLLHDPMDVVCKIEGSEQMMRESLTVPADKQLIRIENGLHALIPNRTSEIFMHMIAWIDNRLVAFQYSRTMASSNSVTTTATTITTRV